MQDVTEKGAWSGSLPQDTDINTIRRCLEVVSVAKRWKATDKGKESGLNQCFKRLGDAVEFGLGYSVGKYKTAKGYPGFI
jgi:hypothetical protein